MNDHVSIEKVNTSYGTEYQIVREDGVVLATTRIKHYAKVIKDAINDDINAEDYDELHG